MPAIYIREGLELPERREHDFYPTDRATIIDALALVRRGGFIPQSILDPGAGTGAWGDVAKQRWPKACLTGVELRDVPAPHSYDFWINGSFLDRALALSPPYDLILGNPPYSEAEAFVRQSLALLRDGGRLVFLLKLSFMAGQRRSTGLYAECPPRWYVPCSRRPSFSGDGNTAPEEYALYIWQHGFKGRETVLRAPIRPRAARKEREDRVYANWADRWAAYRDRKREAQETEAPKE